MYQPHGHGRFTVDDPAAQLDALVRTVPGTLVTLGPDGLAASHPFAALTAVPGWPLGHAARPPGARQPQWRRSPLVAPLILVDGPDAYISPGWYETKRRTGKDVPTWNCVTVHAHGTLTLHHDAAWLEEAVVRRLSDRHEAGRPHPWSVDDAPRDYLDSQLRAIVGVELRLTRLDAKRKLSQNRIGEDAAGVIAGLGAGTAEEQAVAAEMTSETRRT